MAKVMDVISDAFFVPGDDGHIRFVLSLFHGLTVRLDASEAEGMKILWGPLVRYYVIAAHACIPVGIVSPNVGLALLFALWLARFRLFKDIRRRFSGRLERIGKESALHHNLDRSIRRPIRLLLQVLALLSVILGGLYRWLATPEMLAIVEPNGFFCLLLVALNWCFFLGPIRRAPRKKPV